MNARPESAAVAKARFGAEEWDARVQLAAAYRIFHLLGWTELIYNHISLRVPGPQTHFLINPFGLHYSEVTASNLVKIDLQGNIVGHSDWPINPAGFTPHATIHANIAHAHCVMHTHTTAGLAVACLEDGLSMSNFYSAQLHGKLAYHDFEGITVHADEGPRLLAQHWRQAGGDPAQPRAARVGRQRCRTRLRSCGCCSARARSSSPRCRWGGRVMISGRDPAQVHGGLAAVQLRNSAPGRMYSTR